jgi:DNA-binding transcriptional LysR family regulator
MTPDIGTLQAFEAAARHQNFSRAAEELNLTQSAVSRQIADLEQQTGLKLFERVRQRVILSEAGQRFLPNVKDLLERSDRLMIGAASAARMRSSLRIATLPTFGTRWLVPRLGRFFAEHDDVAVTIESRSKPFSFTEDAFDIAIHFGQPVWAGGVPTFLCHEQVLPIANRTLAERLNIQKALDFGRAPLLHLITRPKLWAEWLQLQGADIENAYVGLRLDQFSMMVTAVAAGLGVALLPTYLVEEELASGAFVALLPLPMQTENAYYCVRPEAKQSHLMADAFQAWLISEVSQPRAV